MFLTDEGDKLVTAISDELVSKLVIIFFFLVGVFFCCFFSSLNLLLLGVHRSPVGQEG